MKIYQKKYHFFFSNGGARARRAGPRSAFGNIWTFTVKYISTQLLSHVHVLKEFYTTCINNTYLPIKIRSMFSENNHFRISCKYAQNDERVKTLSLRGE